MLITKEIFQALSDLSIPEKAAFFPKFFKAGKGEYAEGDKFLGVVVPDCRKVAKWYSSKVTLEDVEGLIMSPFHEVRLVALMILTEKFEKSKSQDFQKQVIDFYLCHTQYINNWDLVDASCYKILGRYCYEIGDASILESLSLSENMWEKRMAVVGTLFFIKKGRFDLTKKIVLNNLNHPHDLIHKANGWMLREMGKKNEDELLSFLNSYYQQMPRTTLRYAIERLEEETRQDYLKGRV